MVSCSRIPGGPAPSVFLCSCVMMIGAGLRPVLVAGCGFKVAELKGDLMLELREYDRVDGRALSYDARAEKGIFPNEKVLTCPTNHRLTPRLGVGSAGDWELSAYMISKDDPRMGLENFDNIDVLVQAGADRGPSREGDKMLHASLSRSQWESAAGLVPSTMESHLVTPTCFEGIFDLAQVMDWCGVRVQISGTELTLPARVIGEGPRCVRRKREQLRHLLPVHARFLHNAKVVEMSGNRRVMTAESASHYYAFVYETS